MTRKILKILPGLRKGTTQKYEVHYEENFKEQSCLMKEKEIIRQFAIDKKEFKMILRNSVMDQNSDFLR